VDARASGGGGQCLAGHTIAQGACLIDACRSLAQIQVLCQRRGYQAIEDYLEFEIRTADTLSITSFTLNAQRIIAQVQLHNDTASLLSNVT
ncbi:hypothetical protein, partial [Pseudomonas aeruginosa]|uniref:hypothetical protein n=1 Tax=Pseudomonas aeruginosa TaxID=287 RepID=UPI0039E1FA79